MGETGHHLLCYNYRARYSDVSCVRMCTGELVVLCFNCYLHCNKLTQSVCGVIAPPTVALIHSLARLSISYPPPTHPSTHPLTDSLSHPLTRSPAHSPAHSSTYSLTPPIHRCTIHSSTYSRSPHPLTHSSLVTLSAAHSSTYPLIHLLTPHPPAQENATPIRPAAPPQTRPRPHQPGSLPGQAGLGAEGGEGGPLQAPLQAQQCQSSVREAECHWLMHQRQRQQQQRRRRRR